VSHTESGSDRPKLTRRRGQPLSTSQALVSLPARTSSPAAELGRRALLALGLLTVIVLLVYVDRDAYTDSFEG
jgi:voltage-gated potassium channel